MEVRFREVDPFNCWIWLRYSDVPSKGEITWFNKSLNARQRRWLCGLVFQFPERYFLGLSVTQELRLGHKRLTMEEQNLTLTKVGLINLDLKKPPESLSGGQQRRLV